MPRLRIDKECWKEKQKNLVQEAGKTTSGITCQPLGISNHEEEELRLREEAEQSLEDRDMKRKGDVQEGRKSKKRKLAKLAGWGLPTNLEDEPEHVEP